MIVRRILRRVCSVSEMTPHTSHLVLSPVASLKPILMRSSAPVSLKVHCFRSSKPFGHSNQSRSETTLSSTSLVANRISRVARTEAQDALFDYLHCTRSFPLMDAEHISKNSPHFLKELLSKIENEQDVARSLSKFFRYHPINEFEPFFESLGLCPAEFLSLLPRDLMFLSDDHIMLDNFHVLCDYGVPRGKIGKMYKEAVEVFGYDHGVLALKLRAYEELGLSKSTVIKLVSCCPSLLIGGVNSDLARVLWELRELGIENDWIGRYLNSKSTCNWKRMLDMMDFLDKVGYGQEKMGSFFKTNPSLLLDGSGKKICVLVGRLLKLGVKTNEMFYLFSRNPEILLEKFMKNLWCAVDFLFEIGMEIKDIANIVSSHLQLLGFHSLLGPRTVLRNLKVGRDGLCQIIKEDPLKLFSLASKSSAKSIEHLTGESPNKLLEKTTFLSKLGYAENSDEMMKALKQFRGRGDQLQERFDCLVLAGLDCALVSSMIKQVPTVLNQSKEVLEKKIDCLQNFLGYPLNSLVAFPTYLCYDMERINLRFSMYAWLRKKGVAKPKLSLSTILACSDARFVKYFVNVHPEGPIMWENLQKSSGSCEELI